MALIKNHKVTVIVGIIINLIFVAVKFFVSLESHVNLFFADAVDSFVDGFVIVLILVWLRFNLDGKLTFLSLDFLQFSQWSAIIVFRLVIVLDSVDDLVTPQPRTKAMLVIIVSGIVIAGSVLMAVLFVDEDDVVKFFIDDEEKRARKEQKRAALRAQGGGELKDKEKKKGCKILPIFAEAMDNLVSAIISLLIGLLMHFKVIPKWLYIIDDVSNILISAVMCFFAFRGLWNLSAQYQHKGYERLVNA